MSKLTHGNWTTISMPDGYDTDFDHDLKYIRSANSLPQEKIDITNSCNVPWTAVTVDHKGRVFLCLCDGWLPYSAGMVDNFSSIDEIFNSQVAKEIQKSIIEKKYTFCAVDSCGVRTKSKWHPGNTIFLNIGVDIGCNLSCPSCRERVILDTSEEYLAERYKWIDSIISWIRNSPDKRFDVTIGSNGDPFVSNVYLRCITEIQDLKNVNLSIKTNGLLAKYQLRKLDNIDNIKSLSVSIDAGSKEVYEKVRRGARWETLIDNLEYLSSLTHINKTANFVVQKLNFKDMKNFVELCRSYNMHSNFSHLSDWGTWHNFHEQCVHVPSSPHYAELKEILQDPIFRTANLGILKNI